MEALQNFHFIRPFWFLMLPLILAVWWFWHRASEPLRGWRGQIHPDLLSALTIGDSGPRNRNCYWLLAAWLLAALALAGPTWRMEANPFADDSQPLMVLLKAAPSMEIGGPTSSRLQRAQLKIADLANQRAGQPLGLIAYAGSAHLVLPPTKDTRVVAEMASEISSEIMPVTGDRLDLAFGKALETLNDGQAGSLLVLADAVEQDPKLLAAALSSEVRYPIQFLALTERETPEFETIRAAASSLGASVQEMTADDRDINAIVRSVERRSAIGIAGESSRWQEAGYWLTPLLALLVALSFRRQTIVTE